MVKNYKVLETKFHIEWPLLIGTWSTWHVQSRPVAHVRMNHVYDNMTLKLHCSWKKLHPSPIPSLSSHKGGPHGSANKACSRPWLCRHKFMARSPSLKRCLADDMKLHFALYIRWSMAANFVQFQVVLGDAIGIMVKQGHVLPTTHECNMMSWDSTTIYMV